MKRPQKNKPKSKHRRQTSWGSRTFSWHSLLQGLCDMSWMIYAAAFVFCLCWLLKTASTLLMRLPLLSKLWFRGFRGDIASHVIREEPWKARPCRSESYLKTLGRNSWKNETKTCILHHSNACCFNLLPLGSVGCCIQLCKNQQCTSFYIMI